MRTVSLQQICDIQIGKTPSRSVPEYWGGELPWVTISDFAAGRIVTTTKERITRGQSADDHKLLQFSFNSTTVHPLATLNDMKDAGLRIRVQRGLRDRFQRICQAQDKPARAGAPRIHADVR